ncbi:ATP-dependent helicase HrpB [Granulosicoccus sp.]|nr:ATP-dependent helicase HrpB [Granulosicoccus sp.]MDB4223931.1 ATP-dependent helicase HrpB [Granulosicoccus sp.]
MWKAIRILLESSEQCILATFNHPLGTFHIHALPDSVLALPVMALASDIAKTLADRNVLLRAEPGAGKSTGLPLALLLNGGLRGNIILLEPRRLAARSVAQRLASHLGEKVGQRVGLRMRAETRVSSATQLTVVTEGVLTRLLQDDPTLEGVALVIFDEFHERSLHADFGLALCLEVQQALRDDLRLLLMSATLDTEAMHSQLLGAQQFHCSVRQHPVETMWVGEHSAPLEQRIVQTVLTAIEDQTGDVLVFLPGVAEINRTARLLEPRLNAKTELHRLHSGVGLTAQLKATAPAANSQRRVILATSLAETSITIDGVRVVVDSGLERRGRIDSSSGAQRLETVLASQASATQRAGRAGRTSAGVCYRLWSEQGHSRRTANWQPEIHRADLAPLLLELGLWGASNGNDLPWLDSPPAASLSRAETLLNQLGLWNQGQLTPIGRKVAALPVHPRIGHMLVWAEDKGVAALACRLAVWLDEQTRGGGVDLEPLLNQALPSTLQRRADQLARLLKARGTRGDSPSAAVLLAQAYPDWIAQRRPGSGLGEAARFLLACGGGVVINNEDELAHCQWLSVAQIGGAGSQLRIFKAMELNISELEKYSPELFSDVKHLDWDATQQRVLAERRRMLGNLVVDSKPLHDISNSDKANALLLGIRQLGIDCLPWSDDCREWQARVQRMGKLSLQGQEKSWPTVDDESLMTQLEEWLLPWLDGVGSIKALQHLDLHKNLNAMLDYRQQVLMDEWLPKRYTVPSGSQIRLSYVQPGNPVLSVRLQEMLGCAVNPSVARGQILLKIELLSPARRPVQVTTDLANFWTNSYPAVKKDMAGRYPKHLWPDDPLAAQPTAYAKRRKR